MPRRCAAYHAIWLAPLHSRDALVPGDSRGGFAPAPTLILLNYLCDDNAIINILAYVFYSNGLFHFCDVSFDCELKVCGVSY